MKQLALIQDVPPPKAVTHECGAAAVEQFFFSPRHQKVVSVVVCSTCHPSFYPKAKKLPASVRRDRRAAEVA
jgi:ribosomal protein L31